MPSSSSDDNEIRLNPVEDCFEDPPPGFTPFDMECIPLQDFNPGDIPAGGRVVVVTPYVPNISVCVGQYAQFQVLQGMGGQIHRALFVGTGIGRVTDATTPHEIEVPVNCDETMEGPDEEPGGPGGDLGLAIRDRGRWYVVKLAQPAVTGGAGDVIQVEAYGGNKNPYTGSTMDGYKVSPHRPYIFPRYKEVGLLEEHDLTNDWYGLDTLPDDFEYGDEFTATDDHTLPFGFGWARLARGQTIDQYAWDAAEYDQHLTSADDPDNPPSHDTSFIAPDIADDQIIVTFSEAVSWPAGEPDVDTISITTDSATELEITDITMSGAPEANSFIIQLDRDTDYEEIITISVPAGYVEDADENTNSAFTAIIKYKQERFAFVPVVNFSDQPVFRDQVCYISSVKVEYTINEKTVEWYKMYIDGEITKQSFEVIGGNVLNPGDASYRNTIEDNAGGVANWQDFDHDALGGTTPADIPEVTDGYGFSIGDDSVSTEEGKVDIVRNRQVGRFLAEKDKVLGIRLIMQADGKGTPEYRAVWEVFA